MTWFTSVGVKLHCLAKLSPANESCSHEHTCRVHEALGTRGTAHRSPHVHLTGEKGLCLIEMCALEHTSRDCAALEAPYRRLGGIIIPRRVLTLHRDSCLW